MKTLSILITIGFTVIGQAQTSQDNPCELITYEGEAHSFFNKEKYFKLTIAETDKFLVGLGWLAKPFN